MVNIILAIDPGNIESAYCLIEKDTYKPIEFGKVSNGYLIDYINSLDENKVNALAIEMVASYGMPVGKEVFETCVWIGRFIEEFINYIKPNYKYIYRKEVTTNLCNSVRAKDSNVRQALIDKFATHDLKNGKGTKKNPDWFYGFKADIWSAYAVGVTYLDKEKENGI